MKFILCVITLMSVFSFMQIQTTELKSADNVEDPYPRLPPRNYSCSNMWCPVRHFCGCMPTPITPETPFRDLDCGCYHENDMMPVCA